MKVVFCGHRVIDEADGLWLWLTQTIDQLIEEGADEFLFGGYGAYNQTAFSIFLQKQKQYPHIKSTLVIPDFDQLWDTSAYDNRVYLPIKRMPRSEALLERDAYLVREADVIVAYVLHWWGSAAKMLRCAEEENKRVVRFPKQQEDFHYPTSLAIDEINAMELEDNEIRFRTLLHEDKELLQRPDAKALRKCLDALPIGSELGLRIARDISNGVAILDREY